MLKIAIVENEISQIEETTAMINRFCQEKNIPYEIQSFQNGFDFLESDSSSFELIFMDIDMPGINGMDTAMKIRKQGINSNLIFVTNLPQYAIDGYKVSALDFILKPMTYADFSLAMSRVVKAYEEAKVGQFILSIKGVTRKFQPEEVLFFEMVKHDVVIHLANGENVIFRSSMSKVEQVLPPEIYLKCNSGCIVNLRKIKTLDGDVLVLENEERVLISRSHRKEVLVNLNKLFSNSILPKS